MEQFVRSRRQLLAGRACVGARGSVFRPLLAVLSKCDVPPRLSRALGPRRQSYAVGGAGPREVGLCGRSTLGSSATACCPEQVRRAAAPLTCAGPQTAKLRRRRRWSKRGGLVWALDARFFGRCWLFRSLQGRTRVAAARRGGVGRSLCQRRRGAGEVRLMGRDGRTRASPGHHQRHHAGLG